MEKLKVFFTKIFSALRERTKALNLLRIWLVGVNAITIVLFIYLMVQFFELRVDLADKALSSHQALMVNIKTGEVFNGSVYVPVVEQEVKHDEPASQPEPEPVIETPLDNRVEVEYSNSAKSKVAIIISNLGLSKTSTLDVLNSKKNYTLGFSPYALDLEEWIDQARSKKFEVLMQLPMQPVDYQVNDPGPFAMLINLSNGENLSRLEQLIAKCKKVAGFYTDQNESFSQARASYSPIMQSLARNKMLLVYSGSSDQLTKELCEANEAECLLNTRLIDDELEESKIQRKLLLLQTDAESKGYAIGIVRPYSISLNLVEKWLEKLNPNETAFVTASTLVKDKIYANKPIVSPPAIPVLAAESQPKKEEKDGEEQHH